MSCIASVLYDPAIAVSKHCSTALAMTAMDTTNLRLAFNAPASGRVLVRLAGTLHGATTFPQILFGAMNGTTVVARTPPVLGGGNMTAATLMRAESVFVVGGLTPDQALTWDAAYSVETTVSTSALKYGGPNTSTANNAFGAFSYEIWKA